MNPEKYYSNNQPVENRQVSYHKEITEQLVKTLEKEIPGQFYKGFFSQVKIEFIADQLVIQSEDRKVLDHIKARYGNVIKKRGSEFWGNLIQPVYKLTEGGGIETVSTSVNEIDTTQLPLFSNSKNIIESTKTVRKKKVDESSVESFQTSYPSQIYFNPDYTFDRFLVGDGNEHAFIAAKSAAMHPNKFHNPLYIYGSVGLGKTHLLMAIGNYIQKGNPGVRALYSSAEIFLADIVEASQKKAYTNMRQKYRAIDILLFDDIQLVAGTDFTQEEIFNTFNFLYQNGKQIVITSDRPAQKLDTLKDRLISRFQSGLILDIKPPSLQSRIDILKLKSQEMRLDIDDTILAYVANQFTNQVRHLEAALIKVNFLSTIYKRKLTLNEVKEALQDISERQTNSSLTINGIVEHVAQVFKVSEIHIKSKSRAADVVLARHVAMYLIRILIHNMSLASIASYFNRLDHSTIVHAENKVKKLIVDNKKIAFQIEQLIDHLKSN